ncbi:hypothetical protein ABK905_14865 [Acerihabitans sp. KWT182]|uniref:Uncharacterized protein n=1 Tax=Acerihabitans sp. KWT182 TaxID=3157919 RepID=A0AAU7Q4Q4_9GAMM
MIFSIKKISEQLIVENNPRFVFDVAAARIERGEPCKTVAMQHGISFDSPFYQELEEKAYFGPAGERVLAGESLEVVAREQGILINNKVFAKLNSISRYLAEKTPTDVPEVRMQINKGLNTSMDIGIHRREIGERLVNDLKTALAAHK